MRKAQDLKTGRVKGIPDVFHAGERLSSGLPLRELSNQGELADPLFSFAL